VVSAADPLRSLNLGFLDRASRVIPRYFAVLTYGTYVITDVSFFIFIFFLVFYFYVAHINVGVANRATGYCLDRWAGSQIAEGQ
jgi:hypothetical protein